MNIAQLARRHPAMSITLALVWAASWVPTFVVWTTGIEIWMIGIRYAVLVLVAALVASGARAAGESAYAPALGLKAHQRVHPRGWSAAGRGGPASRQPKAKRTA